MTTSTIQIRTPSRLHFGLLAFGNPSVRQYGGVGMMVTDPGVELLVSEAPSLQVSGPLAERVRQFALHWFSHHHIEHARGKMEVLGTPPDHVGLGVGTQLALAVAAGLNSLYQLGVDDPGALARSVGRMGRSSIGTLGFHHGGLLAEAGRNEGEDVGKLLGRSAVPEEWRVVLICPTAGRGLAGKQEADAIAELSPISEKTTQELTELATGSILPAAEANNFEAFSEAVYRYGHIAGTCFASQQGGPYNGPVLTRLVEIVRQLGVTGVGQSSWGPTLYAFLPGEDSARDFVARLSTQICGQEVSVCVTTPCNEGVSQTVR